jgi:hypothetical protein
MPILFPNLRVKIEAAPADVTEGGVAVLLCQAVTLQCLFLHLLHIPLRPSAKDSSVFCRLPVIWSIQLDHAGSLVDFEAVQSRHCNRNRLLPFSAPGFHLSHWSGILASAPVKDDPSIGLAVASRFSDTFFGLLKLVGYARALEEDLEMASISSGILAPEQVYSTESVSIGSCPAATPVLIALQRDVRDSNIVIL